MNITQPAAHVDQLIRQTRVQHMQLSIQADAKANMMMTLPAIVVTLSIQYVDEPAFQLPAAVLIGFCLATILFASYAAAPKLSTRRRRSTRPNLASPMFNLLYCGDFVRLDYLEFESAMEHVMNDASRTYEAQVREIYTLGRFLVSRKFLFLRLAYLCFIVGFLGSGAVLCVALLRST